MAKTITIKQRTYEVIREQDMTKLPAMSTYIRSIADLRGKRGGLFELLTYHDGSFLLLSFPSMREVARGIGGPALRLVA